MTIWTPSSRSRLSAVVKASIGGGVALTLLLRMEYDRLFSLSPLDTTLPYEPVPLFVASFIVGIVLAVLHSRWADEPLGLYDAFTLAVSTAILPTIVVFSFVTRVGVITGFGPTISIQSFGQVVVGLFFVLLYAGFGAALAGLIFVLIAVGACAGALLARYVSHRFDGS